mmetsp:Transcript_30694/g.46446  ORF Transcript_30694/g.46446 Transcript_30694/m.46446 type:complete len:631 (-) Transcript_30694:1655-3547(-)
MFSTSTPLRAYQERIATQASKKNALVVLPTGSGKTLIASAVMKTLDPKSRTLMLVPTCLLVAQQAKSIASETHLRVVPYSGDLSVPSEAFDVLVSTPAAFYRICCTQNEKFGLSSFALIVFDEVHHVVKRHPYRKISKLVQMLPSHQKPQILGLTASLTYAISNEEMDKSIQELCAELDISKILSSTAQELFQDGYHAARVPVEVKCDQKLEWIPPRMSGAFGVHQVREEFFAQVSTRVAHPLSLALMNRIETLENTIATHDASFVSPLQRKGKFGKVTNWGAYAHGRAIKSNQSVSNMYNQLEDLYEAVRIAVNSRQNDLELSFALLRMMEQMRGQPSSLLTTLHDTFDLYCETHGCYGRLSSLKREIISSLKNFGTLFRGIVFVQQRVVAHILQWYIDSDPELETLGTAVVYATSSPATASLRLTPSQSKERLHKFRRGEVRLLVSTAVSEEGMDVPAANVVIRFDAVQTPVSLVQSRGRARQADSKFIVLAESDKAERSIAGIYRAEMLQYSKVTANDYDCTKNVKEVKARNQISHTNRLKNAVEFLQRKRGEIPAIAVLKGYAIKASCEFDEIYRKEKDGKWRCDLNMFMPGIAKPIRMSRSHTSKKNAKSAAADALLDAIIDHHS